MALTILSSTPDKPKPVDLKHILLIGPPGGGKSTILLQFPKPLIILCDPPSNIDGPDLYLREIVKQPPNYKYYRPTIGDDETPVETNLVFDRIMLALKELKTLANKEFLTLGMDSLLFLNEFNVQKVMKDKGVSELDIRHWGDVKANYFRLLAARMRECGTTTITTCHEKPIMESSKQNIMEKVVVGYEPNVQSEIRSAFGGLFSDVWRCYTDSTGNKTDRVIQTVSDGKFKMLKNTMNMPAKIVIKEGKSAWEALAPWHKFFPTN